MSWLRRLSGKDEEKEREKKNLTGELSAKEYGVGVIVQRQLQERLAEFDKIQWSEEDKKNEQSGAIAFVASLMRIAYGLARAGIASEDSVRSLSWLVSRWQGAIDDGEEVKPLADALKRTMRRFFTLYASVSILPDDVARDIALMVYQGKPGGQMEGQKLLE